MARRSIAVFVLAAFCLFSWNCFPIKPTRTVGRNPSEINRNNVNARIISVVLKSGKTIEFRKDYPGKLVPGADAIRGAGLQFFEFDKKDIKSTLKDKNGRISQIVTLDETVFTVLFAEERGGMVSFSAFAPITIPLSDIQQVWVRTTNFGSIVANTLLWAGVGFAIAIAISVQFWGKVLDAESCPFVYSWNGEEYVLDAEPYGAAVSEGLKRTDWIELSNLKEVDGTYRVLLTNELDETQYTDELKLVAVDHAPGIKVAADLAGRIHTFERPLAPLRATDRNGRDIMPFVGENDQAFLLSDLEARHPDEDGDFRDELVFEFPKPAGAKKAKLLANAWTTQWGSMMGGKFMELYGDSLDETYDDVDRHGPTYRRILKWMADEELYMLKVWLETPDGWEARGMIMGGAPIVTKDKAIGFDVADIPGDVLRIKLRPPVNFWMVNSLAVDYGGDSPVDVTEIAAETAVDQAGRDVRAELAATDGNYLESPNRGERTELVFAAPPLKEGLERTVLVKASGYYKVNIDANGEPRTDLIDRVFDEPGFAARYSFREYLNWAAGLRAAALNEKR